MGRKFSRVKPLRPNEPTTDWEFMGLKYWTRNGNPKARKVRQEARVELHYHTPPRKRTKRTTVAARTQAKASGQMAAITRARLKELRDEQETLANSMRLRADEDSMRGSITPVRQRELAEGFAAAGMAHLIV